MGAEIFESTCSRSTALQGFWCGREEKHFGRQITRMDVSIHLTCNISINTRGMFWIWCWINWLQNWLGPTSLAGFNRLAEKFGVFKIERRTGNQNSFLKINILVKICRRPRDPKATMSNSYHFNSKIDITIFDWNLFSSLNGYRMKWKFNYFY